MDIIITNKIKIHSVMSEQKRLYAVIGLSDLYPDPEPYNVRTNLCRGLLKIEFWDADSRSCSDHEQLFTAGKRDAIIGFVDAMLALKVKVLLIHCTHGRSRSTAVAKALVEFFGDDVLCIRDWPSTATPNPMVLELFREVKRHL